MEQIRILDLGGSIVAQEIIDINFLKELKSFLKTWLEEHPKERIIMIIGGGAAARKYQSAYKEVEENPQAKELDWIGIMATRLNAQMVKAIMGDLCQDEVVINPEPINNMKGQILVAAGWKPGFSTDYDAVVLANNFNAKTILNLSNISKIYSTDPNKDPNAKPLDALTWSEYQNMCGDTWTPGINTPFDPIATQKAKDLKLNVIAANGKDLENLKNIFLEKEFIGTTIKP